MRRTLWVWMLVTLAFVHDWCRSCCACWAEEKMGLLEIKAWINNSSRLENWVDSLENADCCEWYGVRCDTTTKRVIQLSLSSIREPNMGDLYVNASLFLPFKELRNLDLSTNMLVGCFKNQGFNVLAPSLRKLEKLDLQSNGFKDDIFSSLSGLSSLKHVDLSANVLTGSTSELYSLTNLETLFLDYNFLSTNIFRSIGALSALGYLTATNCNLNGTLPIQGWCELKNLVQLILSDNNLHGSLPDCLGNLSSLQVLDVSGNQFTGNIASGPLTNLTSITDLILSRNKFEVPISFKSFANHTNLKVILCADNKLVPEPTFRNFIPKFQLRVFSLSNCHSKALKVEIPNFLHSQYELRVLDLSYNNYSGVLPSWLFENKTRLELVYLGDNSFVGPLPHVLNNPHLNFWPFLNVLDISYNHFTGMLPSWLANMSSLKAIDFSRNFFEGSIPREFYKLDRLEFVDLSENSLSGFIPPSFCPQSLSYVHLSKNRFTGSLTDAFYNSSRLVILNLADNNLIGHIANWIVKISTLRVLVLRANNFGGDFPPQLCYLEQLSILDLSNNKFSGPLPTCLRISSFVETVEKPSFALFLTNPENDQYLDEVVKSTKKTKSHGYKRDIFYYLSGIDLSCNNFTGEIPLEFGELSEISVLNLSRNYLTGHIPSTFSGLNQIEALDLSYNNLKGELPPELIELTCLEVFYVAYNNLSGKTLEMRNQFGTFDSSNYEGNPLLCGPPLQNSCNKEGPGSEGSDHDGFIDMEVFYVTFVVCYIIVVLTIAIVLYINPYWRRRWFYFIENCLDICYYFMLDCFDKLWKFRTP